MAIFFKALTERKRRRILSPKWKYTIDFERANSKAKEGNNAEHLFRHFTSFTLVKLDNYLAYHNYFKNPSHLSGIAKCKWPK